VDLLITDLSNVEIIIVNSSKDATNYYSIPQPPYKGF